MGQKSSESNKKSKKNILAQTNVSINKDEVRLLFDSLLDEGRTTLELNHLINQLKKNGILKDDPRLRSFFTALERSSSRKYVITRRNLKII